MELDGREPSNEEFMALQLSIAFAFLDRNPRHDHERLQDASAVLTSDNAELYLWPIDLESGHVTLTTGLLVPVRTIGYTVDNPDLILRPPLDLHMPFLARSPAPLLLTGIYETVLKSRHSPGSCPTADRVRVAVEWLIKAWRNTATVLYPERLVFLKTAFEAVTGTSNTYESAQELRRIFENLPNTTKRDSEILVWSPEEKPDTRTWNGKSAEITDLEAWFVAFGYARNAIIHEGEISWTTYPGANPIKPIAERSVYQGPFFFTAERLLRGVIRVLLSKCGYRDAWRSQLWRCIRDAVDDA